MINYDFKKLISKRPKGTEVYAPLPTPLFSLEREYQILLRAFVRGIFLEAKKTVVPAYKIHRRATRGGLLVDEEAWFLQVKSFITESIHRASQQFSEIAKLGARRHTKGFMRDAKKLFGIDLSSVVREEDLEPLLREYSAVNSSLIKSLGDDAIKGIEQSVYAAKLDGMSAKKTFREIAKAI